MEGLYWITITFSSDHDQNLFAVLQSSLRQHSWDEALMMIYSTISVSRPNCSKVHEF